MAAYTLTCGRCGCEVARVHLRVSTSAAERRKYGKRYWICDGCRSKCQPKPKVEGKNA